MTEPLNVMRLPLWGSHLIEASAGTGKTWTIAALYLRLVLGAGEEGAAFSRPLSPAEILVLTFTRAATRELSDRIRERLIEAARCFRGQALPDSRDTVLPALLAAFPEGPARATAAWRLAAAAEAMDDASVHTIDAWCQRMLREHAFDSGSLFKEELLADEGALFDEAAHDYWRQQLYPLQGEVLDAALKVWPSVEALVRQTRDVLRHGAAALPHDPMADAEALGELVTRLSAQRAAELGSLKEGWVQRADDLRAWLQGLVDAKPCGVSKSKIQPRFFNAWCDKLAAWAQDPSLEQPGLTDSARHRLTTEGMLEAANPGFDLVMPTALNALVGTLDALDHLVPPAAGLRAHAARQVSRRVAQLKAQHGVYGFADMLERLDAALEGADAAEDDGGLPNRASRLRERIVTQYPVALIDEFQDTSPLQSRIFDKLYRIERNDPETGLLLIGDPKQSIYGFRGADIYSYLTARRATQGRHHVLETNHRSTQDLVAAVNHLFGQAELRAGEGAFLLRRHEHDNPLPFSAVKARGREAVLVHSAVGHAAGHVDASEPVAPITICHELDLLDQRSSQRAFAARCAEQIVVWLNDAGAGFEAAGQPFHRLRPADIAVLVRTGREAEAVRRELRRRGVASVYLSDKDSVFASREALDLLRWVRAVASPRDSRLVRAALATATVGLSLAELMLLADDDEAFDKRSEQLRQLHAVWQSQGVLTMLRQTLHLLSLPSRWMAEPDGERRLTNFLHLAELLQNASRQFDTEQALLRWLELRVEEGREGSASGDDQIVRLESDADLVKVVTVHKSKGLEYPVVLLPFVNSVRTVKKKDLSVLSLVDDSGQRRLHLHVTEAGVTQADKERLREDLRLLYVALTRARHALWLGLGAVKNGNSHESRLASSAIGQVLSGGASLKDGALLQALQGLAAPGSGIHLEAADERPNITPLKPQQDDTLLREAPPFDADFERRWSIGSFSALVRNIVHTPLPLLPSMREDDLLDGAQDQGPAVSNFASNFASSSQAWHAFPRGAMPGNFLHDQLEWLAGEQFALNDVEALQAQLLRRCERQGWGHRGAEVVAWLREVVSRPLAPLGAALDGVGTLLPEMEFWLPSQHLKAADVDRLCREHLLHGVARPPLPQRELHGMLMGFADLVFLHDGRYWVLDYKSNHLGARDADYHQGALEASMAQHRYDVQAGLYMLALHRLLKVRLGAGYRPEQHLGGALYLFLRGVNGPQNGCYHVQPDAEFLEALDQALGVREDVSP